MTRPARKRVLLLAAHLPDGGINTHMLTLGSDLRKLGWEVAICSGAPLVDGARIDAGTGDGSRSFPPVAWHYQQAGIAHFSVAIPDRPRRIRDLPRLLGVPVATWQVLRATRRFRPSVLHSHTRQMGTHARVVQLLLGLPFVSTMHNPVPPSSRLFAMTTFLGSMAVAVSNEIKAILVEGYGMDATCVRVILPGADAEHFRPATVEERADARNGLGIRGDPFVLAFIGSLIPRKRPDTFVQAVAHLVGSGYDVVALMAGRGAEEDAIRAQVHRLGITRQIRILGHQDARRVLWASDALALPSESEGFGMVLAEAMLCGVVAMRTPAGGVDQFTPDENGVVFAFGDHEELGRKVAYLIEHPDFRTALAARGLEDARARFSSLHMARLTEQVYVDAMEDQRG